MAPVYSKRLYAVSGLNGGSSDLAPSAGLIWIVRDIDVYTGGDMVSTTTIRFVDVTTGGTIWTGTTAPGSGGYFSFRGRQVFDATTAFKFTTTGPSDITVSGYELSA